MKNDGGVFLLILFLLAILSIFPFCAVGQSVEFRIKGVVVDSTTMAPVPYATITIKTGNTIKLQKLSDEQGAFDIRVAAQTDMKMIISCIGFVSQELSLPSPDKLTNGEWNAGELILCRSANQLKDVVVSGTAPLVRQQLDKITYDVQRDIEGKTANMLDILRKVPLVQVDMSGNISVDGKNTYLVLLNGKPYALYKNKPTEALRSLKAGLVKEVQVITTPASRYRAQGYTDVVNIVTIEKKLEGYQGSLNTSLSSLNHYEGNLVVNRQWDKIGWTALLNGAYDNLMPYSNTASIVSGNNPRTKLYQSGTTDFDFAIFTVLQEMSYAIDSVNLLLVSASYTNNPYNQIMKADVVESSDDIIRNASTLSNLFDKISRKLTGEIYFQHEGIKNKEKILTLGYKVERPTVRTNTVSDIVDFNTSSLQSNIFYNNTGYLEHQGNINYALPVKELLVEAGLKAIFRNKFSDGEFASYDTLLGRYVKDANRSPTLTYQQNVQAIYNSYYYRRGKFGAKLYVSLERTAMKSDMPNMPGMISFNLLPLVDVQYRTAKGRFSFVYEQSISRPSIQELSNFRDFSNPNFATVGNPALVPAVGHRINLAYSTGKKHFWKFDAGYSFINNSIEAVSVSENADTITTTFQNIGKDQIANFRTNAAIKAGKGVDLNINTYINYVVKAGSDGNGVALENKGIQWGITSATSIILKGGYSLYADIRFFSPRIRLQQTGFWWIENAVGVSKRLFQNKGTITAAFYNPFQRHRLMVGVIDNTTFYQRTAAYMPIRKLDVRFSYSFGRLKKPMRKPETRIQTDDIDTKEF